MSFFREQRKEKIQHEREKFVKIMDNPTLENIQYYGCFFLGFNFVRENSKEIVKGRLIKIAEKIKKHGTLSKEKQNE